MFKFQPSFVVFVLFVLLLLLFFFLGGGGGRGILFSFPFFSELVFSLFLLLALFLGFTRFCEPYINFLGNVLKLLIYNNTELQSHWFWYCSLAISLSTLK